MDNQKLMQIQMIMFKAYTYAFEILTIIYR
jgi:hypothetical protein